MSLNFEWGAVTGVAQAHDGTTLGDGGKAAAGETTLILTEPAGGQQAIVPWPTRRRD